MTTTEYIQPADLEPILIDRQRRQALTQSLEQISTIDGLLRALARYIHFNSVFGGGVANLAGEVAVRQDLFRDPREVVQIIADRSVEVASDIFFAAIDEFDERATSHRDTHRSLAQATLKASGEFLGYDPVALDNVARLNESTLSAVRKVRDGYGIGQSLDEPKLFRAMGFHMGSEILADEEFRELDWFLRARYPELVAYLEKTEVEFDGVRLAAYFWIRIHTTVEAIHFEFAAKGVNRALHYYAGAANQAQLKGYVLEGFSQFASVQTEFVEHLLDK